MSWTVTSPPVWLPMRETQGDAAELASDGRSGRTRSTTRTDCKEEEEEALAIGKGSTRYAGAVAGGGE